MQDNTNIDKGYITGHWAKALYLATEYSMQKGVSYLESTLETDSRITLANKLEKLCEYLKLLCIPVGKL